MSHVRISDSITAYILQRMEQADSGVAELKRNELAEKLGCVPSQILREDTLSRAGAEAAATSACTVYNSSRLYRR